LDVGVRRQRRGLTLHNLFMANPQRNTLLRMRSHPILRAWTAVCACALSFAVSGASAAEVPQGPAAAASQPSAHRPRIGLVLSGGGARGLAHIGVLKVLEREHIPVDVIAGTSMGAIVGGLYASGLSAADIEREVADMDWDNAFASRVDRRQLSQRRKEQDVDVSPLLELGIGGDGIKAPIGALSSRTLEAQLRRLTLRARQVRSFDELPTPFRAVATDMETGEAMILKDGDLATAMRSSMSVPGVFAPVEVDGRILGDGTGEQPAGGCRPGDGCRSAHRCQHWHALVRPGVAQLSHGCDGADDQHPHRAERAPQLGQPASRRCADRAQAQ